MAEPRPWLRLARGRPDRSPRLGPGVVLATVDVRHLRDPLDEFLGAVRRVGGCPWGWPAQPSFWRWARWGTWAARDEVTSGAV